MAEQSKIIVELTREDAARYAGQLQGAAIAVGYWAVPVKQQAAMQALLTEISEWLLSSTAEAEGEKRWV